MSIVIKTYHTIEQDPTGSAEPVRRPFQYVVYDDVTDLDLGVFTLGEDGSEAEILAAALGCKAQYEAKAWTSPFTKHRELLLASHGGARRLSRLVLSLYNGLDFPLDASELGALENSHLEIAFELIRSYHRVGERDRAFMAVCQDIMKVRGIGPYAEDRTAFSA